MDGSPHLTIGYRLSGESRMQVLEGSSPSYELRGPRFGELTINMAECKGLALMILARIEK
jgi:hypothetical protein